MGAIQLTHDPVFHARTKDIELSYYFIYELVSTGFLQVLFVRSNNQLADLFTKRLPLSTFHSFRDKLLWHPPIILRGHDRIQDIFKILTDLYSYNLGKL